MWNDGFLSLFWRWARTSSSQMGKIQLCNELVLIDLEQWKKFWSIRNALKLISDFCFRWFMLNVGVSYWMKMDSTRGKKVEVFKIFRWFLNVFWKIQMISYDFERFLKNYFLFLTSLLIISTFTISRTKANKTSSWTSCFDGWTSAINIKNVSLTRCSFDNE